MPLPYGEETKLGEFMSRKTLNAVAVTYQDGLLQRLSDRVKGVDDVSTSCADALNAIHLHRYPIREQEHIGHRRRSGIRQK